MKPNPTTIASSTTAKRFLDPVNRPGTMVAANWTVDAKVFAEHQGYGSRGATPAGVATRSQKHRPSWTVIPWSVNGDDLGRTVAVSGQLPGRAAPAGRRRRKENIRLVRRTLPSSGTLPSSQFLDLN